MIIMKWKKKRKNTKCTNNKLNTPNNFTFTFINYYNIIHFCMQSRQASLYCRFGITLVCQNASGRGVKTPCSTTNGFF